MTTSLKNPVTVSEKINPRTEAALERLRKAMRDIEAEVQTSNGIYPFNFGRVTQSELCRRADVKKATLQNSIHKDTTRVEIMGWLDQLGLKLTQTRESTRERVTEVTESLSAEVERLSHALQVTQARLATAEQLIEQFKLENANLRSRLTSTKAV